VAAAVTAAIELQGVPCAKPRQKLHAIMSALAVAAAAMTTTKPTPTPTLI